MKSGSQWHGNGNPSTQNSAGCLTLQTGSFFTNGTASKEDKTECERVANSQNYLAIFNQKWILMVHVW